MSTPKRIEPSEADIIFNRANIALARSQRLVASWLPPRTDDERKKSAESTKIGDEGEDGDGAGDDQDGVFTAVPERLGLGAAIPAQNGYGSDALNMSVNGKNKLDDKLRQRLLGKNAKKFMQQQKQQQSTPTAHGNSDKVEHGQQDDEEEEEGRTSLGRNKKKAKAKNKKRKQRDDDGSPAENTSLLSGEREVTVPVNGASPNDEGAELNGSAKKDAEDDENVESDKLPTSSSSPSSSSKRKKGTGSYLDELLQDRKKKKKRRE